VNCVVQQLLVVLRRRKCVGNSRRRHSRETQEPQFHPKALEVLIDQIAAFRYPGKGARIAYEALEEKERKLLKKYHKQMEEKIFEWGSIHSFAALKALLQKHGHRDYKGFAEALQEAYRGHPQRGHGPGPALLRPLLPQGRVRGAGPLRESLLRLRARRREPSRRRALGAAAPAALRARGLARGGRHLHHRHRALPPPRRPCKVVFGSACVFEYHPEGWGELDEHGNSARKYKTLVWNIRGDHAFFYDLPKGCKLELKKLTERPREKVRTHPLEHGRPDRLQRHGGLHRWPSS
jgi:hypothetical protein